MMNKYCTDKKCILYNLVLSNGKFCTECGRELVEVAKCGYCDAQLAPNTNFCGECGKPNK